MKRTTKKLSGTGLELFLRRFYGSYADIDTELARTLAKDGTRTFSSVRVRPIAWRNWRARSPARPDSRIAISDSGADVESSNPGPDAPEMLAHGRTAPGAAITANQDPAPMSEAAFDPYAIGLVPTFQREGADGLLAKLSQITSIDNLRKMARSQQVALPADLRAPDADIAAIRGAIVEAVDRRIANRRAAAG